MCFLLLLIPCPCLLLFTIIWVTLSVLHLLTEPWPDKWGPQLSQPITNSCQMQVISMQKVFNVNVLTFIRKCVTLVKATWDLGLTTLRMFGSTPAWLLSLLLACLLIKSSLGAVAGRFRDMRAVGSARQSGAGSARSSGSDWRCFCQRKSIKRHWWVIRTATLMPISKDYESRKLIMNAACTDEPAIIVVPKTDLDVAVALKAAKNSELPLRFANKKSYFPFITSCCLIAVCEVVDIATPVTV